MWSSPAFSEEPDQFRAIASHKANASCRSFAANAVRLQLHGLAYNLGNFLRTLATPEPIQQSLKPHQTDLLQHRCPSHPRLPKGGSKTGQITRYKNRTDDELATARRARLANTR
jgi:hypothetical protein